jgi:polyisoprenoid-binding protein YceI
MLAGCSDQGVEQIADTMSSAATRPDAPAAERAETPQAVPEPAGLNLPEEAARPTPADAGAARPVPSAAGSAGSRPASVAPPAGFMPVPISAGVATLTPENTTIQFIGKHTDGGENDPRARTGVFEKFTAEVAVDPASNLLKSASAEINATSLYTPIGNLTNHLTNPEFLDVEMHPTIKFQSTRIEPAGEPGKVSIVGDLTMHGVTKEITLPARVTMGDSGITVHAEWTLNRRDFGINHRNIDGRVLPNVELTLMVGKKTERPRGGR